MDFLIATYGIEGLTKCVLSVAHLVGLVLALGTTLYLDGACFYSIAGRSWERYTTFMSESLFSFATKYVVVGLAILWLSGIGFLAHYAVFEPEKLSNPKIYAKLTLVCVLTANGYFLHHHVLGRVVRMKDCGQFLRSKADRLCMFSGALSGATWTGAFLLGALPILNNAVAFSVLVAAWAALVVTVYLCAKGFIALAARRDDAPDTASSRSANRRAAAEILKPMSGQPIATALRAGSGSAYRATSVTKKSSTNRLPGFPARGDGSAGRTGRVIGRTGRQGYTLSPPRTFRQNSL